MTTEPAFTPKYAIGETVLVQFENGYRLLTVVTGHRHKVVDSHGVFLPEHRYYVKKEAWWAPVTESEIVAAGNEAAAQQNHSDKRSRLMPPEHIEAMKKRLSKAA